MIPSPHRVWPHFFLNRFSPSVPPSRPCAAAHAGAIRRPRPPPEGMQRPILVVCISPFVKMNTTVICSFREYDYSIPSMVHQFFTSFLLCRVHGLGMTVGSLRGASAMWSSRGWGGRWRSGTPGPPPSPSRGGGAHSEWQFL